MKSFIASCLAATAAVAAPLATRQTTNIDPVVLQFALTLEHLENFFYKQALQNYTAQDFADAGFPPSYYNNLLYVASDEESHVKLLTGALQGAGQSPVAACTYAFPSTDVKSFVTLSSIIEGVGSSAYLGGAPLITSKSYLTVAGSILVTEALHTSYQRNAIGEVPFPTPYGTPLDPTSVFSIAAAFIVKCPDTNTPLPFTPFPGLTYNAPTKAKRDWNPWGSSAPGAPAPAKETYAPQPAKETYAPQPAKQTYAPEPAKNWSPEPAKGPKGNSQSWEGWYPSAAVVLPAQGSTVSFTAASAIPAGSFVTFISGLVITSVPGTINGNTISASIPATVGGQTYVFVSNADQETTFNDNAVLFGPAIVEVAPLPVSIDFGYIKA